MGCSCSNVEGCDQVDTPVRGSVMPHSHEQPFRAYRLGFVHLGGGVWVVGRLFGPEGVGQSNDAIECMPTSALIVFPLL
jgi:hypothetical protein